MPNLENIDANDEKEADIKMNDDELIEYIRDFVKKTLKNKQKCTSGASSQLMREIKKEFLQMATSYLSEKCSNCQFPRVKYRKEGDSKIFRSDLTKKHKLSLIKRGIHNFDLNVLAGLNDIEIAGEEDDKMDTSEEHSDEDKMDTTEDFPEKNEEQSKATLTKTGHVLLTPMHLQKHMENLFKHERTLIDLLFSRPGEKQASPYLLFLKVLAVPPNRFRPAAIMQDAIRENPQNFYYTKILNNCVTLNKLSKDKDKDRFDKIIVTWIQLQQSVRSLFDSSKADTSNPPAGIKQTLEKKEGLFRMHMMVMPTMLIF